MYLTQFYRGTPPDFAATVQHTWALILALADNIPRDQSFIPAGKWINALPLNTFIGGSTLGLLGLGRLGLGTGRIGKLAFGMNIIAWSQNLTQEKADEQAQSCGLPAGSIQAVSKEEVFAESDILSVHYVLSDRSKGIVGKADLERMKRSATIINTSRGPLIDEKALLDALDEGKIRGAALDVFDIEPLLLDSRWRTTPWGEDGRSEVVMTPHTGYSFETSLEAMWEVTKSNLERLAAGEELKHQIT